MTTPRKKVPKKCFLCDRKRYFSLSGVKSTDLISKLSFLTNEKNIEVLKLSKLGICRPCAEKVNTCYIFVSNIREKICTENEGGEVERNKRMIDSPLTPKIEPDVPNPAKKQKRTTKTFQSSSSGAPMSHDGTTLSDDMHETDQGICTTADNAYSVASDPICTAEHGYSSSAAEDVPSVVQSSSPSALDVLKECLKDEPESNNLVVEEIANIVVSKQVMLKAVQSRLLQNIQIGCSTLVSRNASLCSVLSRHRSVGNLVQHGDHLLDELIREMSERIPFVLDIFTNIATAGREPSESKIAPVAAAYAILMNARNDKLSAWHRLTTFVAIKGHLDDTALTRLNHMGVTLSVTSRLSLRGEVGERIGCRAAADTVAAICDNIDKSVALKKAKTRHHIPDEQVASGINITAAT